MTNENKSEKSKKSTTGRAAHRFKKRTLEATSKLSKMVSGTKTDESGQHDTQNLSTNSKDKKKPSVKGAIHKAKKEAKKLTNKMTNSTPIKETDIAQPNIAIQQNKAKNNINPVKQTVLQPLDNKDNIEQLTAALQHLQIIKFPGEKNIISRSVTDSLNANITTNKLVDDINILLEQISNQVEITSEFFKKKNLNENTIKKLLEVEREADSKMNLIHTIRDGINERIILKDELWNEISEKSRFIQHWMTLSKITLRDSNDTSAIHQHNTLQNAQETSERTPLGAIKEEEKYLAINAQELEEKYQELKNTIKQTQANIEYLLSKKNDLTHQQTSKDNIERAKFFNKITPDKLQNHKTVSKIDSYVKRMQEIQYSPIQDKSEHINSNTDQLDEVSIDGSSESHSEMISGNTNLETFNNSEPGNPFDESNSCDATNPFIDNNNSFGATNPSEESHSHESTSSTESSFMADNNQNNEKNSGFWQNISWEKSAAIGTSFSLIVCTTVGITLYTATNVFQKNLTINTCLLALAAIIFAVITTLIIHKYNQNDIDKPGSQVNEAVTREIQPPTKFC